MERPKELGNREFLTDQELAEKVAAAKSRLAPKDEAAARAQRAKFQSETTKGIAGEEYNEVWFNPVQVAIAPWKRTSLVIDPPDGRIPPLTPKAIKRLEQKHAARSGRGEGDTWEDRNLSERCLLTTMIRFASGVAGDIALRQIFQSPGYVAITLNAFNSDAPIIVPLDRRPRPGENVRTWFGVPRGHWEGDTLVVETTQMLGTQDAGKVMPSHLGFTAPNAYPGSGETLRLIERYTRTAADTIEYKYTVEDPETYVAPYTVLRPLTKQADDLLIVENACHEGNYGIVGQLSAARADETYAMKAAQLEAADRQNQLKEMNRKTEEWMKTHSSTR